jgi:hypothetical protein
LKRLFEDDEILKQSVIGDSPRDSVEFWCSEVMIHAYISNLSISYEFRFVCIYFPRKLNRVELISPITESLCVSPVLGYSCWAWKRLVRISI